MEHSVKEFFFGPETALSHVGIWEKKLFVALGYSLIDEERKEGGKKNRNKWKLEHTFGGKINEGEEYGSQNNNWFLGRL